MAQSSNVDTRHDEGEVLVALMLHFRRYSELELKR